VNGGLVTWPDRIGNDDPAATDRGGVIENAPTKKSPRLGASFKSD
jgi:hypothetical protein